MSRHNFPYPTGDLLHQWQFLALQQTEYKSGKVSSYVSSLKQKIGK